MDPGRMDRRVDLQRPDKSTAAAGDAVTEYTTVVSAWAQIEPLTGREGFTALERFAEVTHRIRIRWLPGFTAEWRIVHAGREYDLVHVAEIGRREGFEILAVARAE